MENTKWYDKKWIVRLLLIFLYPVGLYAFFRGKKNKPFVLFTILIIFYSLIIYGAILGNNEMNKDLTTIESESKTKHELHEKKMGEIQSTTKNSGTKKNTEEQLRLSKIKEMNQFCSNHNLNSKFDYDRNNSKTLVWARVSTMQADNLVFHTSAIGYGTTVEELKKLGFDKVRIYSSKDGYKKYKLELF